MKTLRRLLVIPMLLTFSTGLCRASEVIDGAKLFSPAAIRRAEASLDRAEKSTGHSAVIETIESLDGKNVSVVALEHAKRHPSASLFVLISKGDHKLALKEHPPSLTQARIKEIESTFTSSLAKGDFDGSLTQGADQLASVLVTIPAARKTGAQTVPTRRNAPQAANGKGSMMGFLLTIGAIVIVVLIAVKILGALSGRGQGSYGPGGGMRPGMGGGGGPGYGGGGGGGGGGFFSSMMGGIGGAMAGNWLYDQFRGRNHGDDYNSGNQGASGNEAGADPGWGGGGEADWGGGDTGGGGDAGGGGGDWGGGGGGDWGGGGGDGGGGGGDWG